VIVDKDTDIDLRTYLASQGMKKGDLSKFIEEAVRWRLFHSALTDVRSSFEDLNSAAIEALVDEAIAAVRANPEAYDRDP
jgi:hypothetical protein